MTYKEVGLNNTDTERKIDVSVNRMKYTRDGEKELWGR